MGFYSKVILDSIAPCGKRLTTLEIRYPRFIHSEFMTHRMFCLDGDVRLTFGIPSTNEKDTRAGIDMSLLEYVNAWNSNSTVEMSAIWNEDRALNARDLRIFQLNEKTNEIQTAKVLRVFESGTKEVWEVTAGTYKVSGSRDHRLLTSAGWKTISELSTNDCLIISVSNKKSQVQINTIKSLGNKSTYDLEINGEFPNFLANNVVVHNSRNSASSRAIPVNKMIEMIEKDPAMPIHFGKAQTGMQAELEVDEVTIGKAKIQWLKNCSDAIEGAKALRDLGLHKQIVNKNKEGIKDESR